MIKHLVKAQGSEREFAVLLLALMLCGVGVPIHAGTAKSLVLFSLNSSFYTYIAYVPIASAYLIYENRKEVFSEVGRSLRAGGAVIFLSILLHEYGKGAQTSEVAIPPALSFSLVCYLIGGFITLFGLRASLKAVFPLTFLLLLVPPPEEILDMVTTVVHKGSTEGSSLLFRALGVNFSRDGYLFYLPGATIEVSRECSGLRAVLALLLASLISGQLFLKRFITRALLVATAFPIAIIKNSVRIVTLSLLAAYADERVFDIMHNRGYILFFTADLVLLGVVLWGLRKLEGGSRQN